VAIDDAIRRIRQSARKYGLKPNVTQMLVGQFLVGATDQGQPPPLRPDRVMPEDSLSSSLLDCLEKPGILSGSLREVTAMARETKNIETTDISQIPELLRLAREVRMTIQPKSLRIGGEEVGILMPPRKLRRRRPGRTPHLTADDSFWDIVGMSDAKEGPTDVSANKDRYLAEAYAPKDP
jgi:hypothetical protein